jgi:IS30 family transposase
VEGAGRKGALLTMLDRKSQLVRIEPLQQKWARETHLATLKGLRKLKIKSLTNDNGLEFSAFKNTARKLNAPIYFTRPYASWERGSIENMNGLIRQYFPKKTCLKEIQHAQIKKVEQRLNSRPRKNLGYKTPQETHFKQKA